MLLTAIQTFDLFTYNMITPVIAKYALAQGATLAWAGVVASVFAFVALVARPASGFLSDRLGRKRIVMVSIVVACAAQVGYAFATSLVALVALRAVHGFFYALFGTAISALALDAIPEERRSEGMGWFGTSYVFANALGPAFGVLVSDRFGFAAMFLAGAVVAAASFALGLFVRVRSSAGAAPSSGPARDASGEPPRTSPTAAKPRGIAAFISVKSLPLAIAACCYLTIWSIIATYIVLVGDERGVVGISAFFVVNSLTLLVSRPFAGRRADRHGLSAVFYPSAVFEAVAVVLIAFSQQLWLFLAAAACKALGSGTVTPSIQARCGQLEPPERSGVAMSTYLLGTDVGYALGPIIGGVVSGAFGFTAMFLAGLPILAVGVAVYALWTHEEKKRGNAR
ncbi:hypothetical protein C1878_05035 [Gordonibacter sp. 28C]|nr:hypothetical protein C1878_05035 [Gordonibacter sp. 28C]